MCCRAFWYLFCYRKTRSAGRNLAGHMFCPKHYLRNREAPRRCSPMRTIQIGFRSKRIFPSAKCKCGVSLAAIAIVNGLNISCVDYYCSPFRTGISRYFIPIDKTNVLTPIQQINIRCFFNIRNENRPHQISPTRKHH